MEDLPMKKVLFLSMVVAIALLGTQVFASPPITPPVEGFIIHSFTDISCDPTTSGKNSVTESESFKWTYFEGWGKGPFYPGNNSDQWNCAGSGCVNNLGFEQGAEIRYEQTFEAKDGPTTFTKTFDALSKPATGGNNLVVSKKIDFEALDPATGYAKHTEKVGLSVVSMGKDSSSVDLPTDFLSLCPWTASIPGTSGGGYPPTNEGIAAGSSFNVTKLVGFESSSKVNSSINPALSYDVSAQGEGTISAAFVVDLWEGPKDFVWKAKPVDEQCTTCTCPTCYAPTDKKMDSAWGLVWCAADGKPDELF